MCDVRVFNYVRTLKVVYFVACLFSFSSLFLFLFLFGTFHGEIKISISYSYKQLRGHEIYIPLSQCRVLDASSLSAVHRSITIVFLSDN